MCDATPRAPGRAKTRLVPIDRSSPHPDHTRELKRLNRIIGQLEGIRRMVEERRYCADILMQTRAATSAIQALEAVILEDHIRHCVTAAFSSKNPKAVDEKVSELLALFEKRA